MFNFQPCLITPSDNFFRGLAVAIQRPEPIKINMVHFIEGEFRVIEQLANIPVKKALQVDFPLSYAQEGNVFRHFDLQAQPS